MCKAVAAIVISAIVMAPVLARAKGKPVSPQLVVRVYDAFGVNQEEMATARATAGTVFRRAGIEVAWRDCSRNASDQSSPACDRPVGSAEVLIRIVPARPHETANTLGFSLVHLQQPIDCLATVLVDRVELMATRTQSEGGKLLGRVIAHEIGHLLLGTTAHSSSGLMRARWLDEEIRRDRPLDWMLSRGDAKQVRLGLLARSAL